MRKLSAVLAVMLVFLSLQAQNSTAYFLTAPCLTPDGQTIIFSFEGDLWKSDMKNGQASRLTAMEGYETDSRVRMPPR
jgi:tricorn protease-like protein